MCLFSLRFVLCNGVCLVNPTPHAPKANKSASPHGAEAERAWKLWFFLPRMLLHRPADAPRVPKEVFAARLSASLRGEWAELFRQAIPSEPRAPAPTPPATLLVKRHAEREGPLDLSTLASCPPHLTDPVWRPAQPYEPLDPALLAWTLEAPVTLSRSLLRSNRARRGAAPGPSGHTAEIVRLWTTPRPQIPSRRSPLCLLSQLPPASAAALGLGRPGSLQKPNGGVRGIVVRVCL